MIYFNTSFCWVNHQGILRRLCTVGIGGSVLSIYLGTVSIKPMAALIVAAVRDYTN